MIFTDRKVTIRNGKSTINEPVILYRGDYEVSIKFTIMESKFRFKSGVNLVDSEKASFGQLAILAPYGGNVFSEIVKCEDGTVTFTLTKEMIDQLEEVGLYSFQIRLFDYYRESRVSIPPVEFGIEVREPVASEDHDNTVNEAIVGYSIAKVVDGLNEDVPDTFDTNGKYNKTDWGTGDRISHGKLNKIEDAIDKLNQNKDALNKQMTSNFNVLQNQIDNMVIESGNTDAEVEQARGKYNLLNQRLNAMDETDVELVSQLAQNTKNISNSVSVEFFGAIGDGITDDTSALQNAINYCINNKVKLKFGFGKYKITETLHIHGQIHIEGVSDNSIIYAEGLGNLLKIEGNTLLEGGSISYLSFLDKNSLQDSTMIKMNNIQRWEFKKISLNCNNWKYDTTAIELNTNGGGYRNQFYSCYVGNNFTTALKLLSSGGDSGVNNTTFYGCSFYPKESCLYIRSYDSVYGQMSNICFVGCDMQNNINGSNLIDVNNITYLSFTGCRFEHIPITDNSSSKLLINEDSYNIDFYTCFINPKVIIEDKSTNKANLFGSKQGDSRTGSLVFGSKSYFDNTVYFNNLIRLQNNKSINVENTSGENKHFLSMNSYNKFIIGATDIDLEFLSILNGFTIKGDIIPSSSKKNNLGNASRRLKDIHMGGFLNLGVFASDARPSVEEGITIGAMIYDSTLKKPIWFDGSSWRDASGTRV